MKRLAFFSSVGVILLTVGGCRRNTQGEEKVEYQKLPPKEISAAGASEAPTPFVNAKFEPPVPYEMGLPPPPAAIPPFVGSATPGPDGYAPQTADRIGLLSLLHARRFADLERSMEAYQSAFELDYRKEFWPLDALDAFDSFDPRLGPLIEEWLKAAPESFGAWAARGVHKSALGWFYRGPGFASETTAQQFAAFESLEKKAVKDLEKSISLRPRFVAAYVELLKIAESGGVDPASSLKKALELSPESVQPRTAFMLTLLPQWGGSLEEMQRFAEESVRNSHNPRIRQLFGFVPYRRSADEAAAGAYSRALESCNESLTWGENALFLGQRAFLKNKSQDYSGGRADLDRAIELRPQLVGLLISRSQINLKLHRVLDAADDMIKAVLLNPAGSASFRIPEMVDGLLEEKRRLTRIGQAEEAARVVELVRQLDPRNAEIRESEPALPASIQDVTTSALSTFEECRHREFELLRAKRFDKIVELWSAYLDRHPDDGKAYYRRSVAYSVLKDLERSRADARRACDFGYAYACRVAEAR